MASPTFTLLTKLLSLLTGGVFYVRRDMARQNYNQRTEERTTLLVIQSQIIQIMFRTMDTRQYPSERNFATTHGQLFTYQRFTGSHLIRKFLLNFMRPK